VRALIALILGAGLGVAGTLVIEDTTWLLNSPSLKQYISFSNEVSDFNNTLAGCGTLNDASCNPSLGHFDLAKWRRLRDSAAKVFDLKVPE